MNFTPQKIRKHAKSVIDNAPSEKEAIRYLNEQIKGFQEVLRLVKKEYSKNKSKINKS